MTDPWLELDSLGTSETLVLTGDRSVTLHDTVARGDAFTWVFSVVNGGNGIAERATIDMTVDDTADASVVDAFLAVIDATGTLVGILPASAVGAGGASVGPYAPPSGWIAYAVVFAEALEVSNVHATAVVDYDADATDTQQPLLPLPMSEVVSIQPPQ